MNSSLDLFAGISDWFWDLSNGQGALICPWHHTSHTGKNVYVIELDLWLWSKTGKAEYLTRATQRIAAVLAQLGQDNETHAWIFLPGRHGPRNLSNNVIDCGACVDVLSLCAEILQDQLSAEQKSRIKSAIYKVCDSYLVQASVSKEITNQRLWGATGLARAYKVFGQARWKNACIESVERSLTEQNSDGSFPYHSNWCEYRAHQGINDITPYYHSRHLAFLHHILMNTCGEVPTKYLSAFYRGCDFLVGITRPNGIKEMALECKRYYWNNSYEVGSNSFDVYALTAAWQMSKNALYGHYAQQSLAQLHSHRHQDGHILGSKSPKLDFKCPIFVNAQSSWASRVVDQMPKQTIPAPQTENFNFADAGLVKQRDPAGCLMVRYKKRKANITWGSLCGGGSLVYFSKTLPWNNLVSPPSLFDKVDANFIIRGSWRERMKNFWACVHENSGNHVRFRLWIGSIEIRVPKLVYGLSYPFRVIVAPFFGALSRAGSSSSALIANFNETDQSLTFDSYLSDYSGTKIEGTTILRTYTVTEDGIEIQENLKTEHPLIGISYALPRTAYDVVVTKNNKKLHFLSNSVTDLGPNGSLNVFYRL